MDIPAIDPTELNRLKWRCKRGLLENDLFIERFFREQGAALTVRHVAGLQPLMDLPDNDLLDLLLARREPDGELDIPEVNEVLALMRRPAAILKKGNSRCPRPTSKRLCRSPMAAPAWSCRSTRAPLVPK